MTQSPDELASPATPPDLQVKPIRGRSSERRPRVRRITEVEFDETLIYRHPTHLREAITDLPQALGVYIFHGEDGNLPLYIGKSINIRSRILSHLRTSDEARMLRQTRYISPQRTAGEVGALLLEARLIKTQHPLHNQKLRLSRQLCAWRLVDDRPPWWTQRP